MTDDLKIIAEHIQRLLEEALPTESRWSVRYYLDGVIDSGPGQCKISSKGYVIHILGDSVLFDKASFHCTVIRVPNEPLPPDLAFPAIVPFRHAIRRRGFVYTYDVDVSDPCSVTKAVENAVGVVTLIDKFADAC